jgi:hypothetical protein
MASTTAMSVDSSAMPIELRSAEVNPPESKIDR